MVTFYGQVAPDHNRAYMRGAEFRLETTQRSLKRMPLSKTSAYGPCHRFDVTYHASNRRVRFHDLSYSFTLRQLLGGELKMLNVESLLLGVVRLERGRFTCLMSVYTVEKVERERVIWQGGESRCVAGGGEVVRSSSK